MTQAAENAGLTFLHVLSVENPLWQEITTDAKDANIKCMKPKFKKQDFISVHFATQRLISESLALKMKKTDKLKFNEIFKLRMIIFYRYSLTVIF